MQNNNQVENANENQRPTSDGLEVKMYLGLFGFAAIILAIGFATTQNMAAQNVNSLLCMTTNSGLGFKVDHCSGLCFKITNWFIKLPFSFIWPFMPLAFLLLHIKFLSAYWLFLLASWLKYVYKFAKYLKNMNKQLPVNIIKIEMQIFSWTLRNYLGFYNILSLHSSV